jgi:flagella basal body P-ring formation protein FlgA
VKTFNLQPSTCNRQWARCRAGAGSLLWQAGGCWIAFILFFAVRANAADAATFCLFPVAQTGGEGIFLQQLVTADRPLPALKLCASPMFGKVTELTRAQVNDLIAAAAPDLATTNWNGAAAIRISRRSREFSETDLLAQLTATLQHDYVKDKGELELSLTQPWNPPVVPDEPLTVKILELPTAGVSPSFIVRFELHTAQETLGAWQTSVKAQVWREVWVAHSSLQRGVPVAEADIARERRDVVNIRKEFANFAAGDDSLEIAEFVTANMPLLADEIRPKVVIHRGQVAEAQLDDGALSIRMKVIALEDGAPGQNIRLRNPVSQKNLNGTVLDGQTIAITL